MTEQTAQPGGAAESLSVSDAVQALLGQTEQQTRDERGRFARGEAPDDASEAADEAPGEEETEPLEPEGDGEEDGEEDTSDEAADEAQPADDVPLPTSWSEEDAAVWKALPADAKAKIFAREAQRDAAVGAKFQEAANAKKAAEAEAQQAAQHRTHLLEQIDVVSSLVQPQRPNPEMLNPNAEGYDPEGYMRAQAEFEAAREYLGALQQQRQSLAAQQAQEEARAFAARNEAGMPALLQAVPDLADQTKAPAAISQIRSFANSSGFSDDEIAQASSAEVLILWKAMQYDRQKAAAQQAKATAKPQPKPATPVVRPGVSTPQSSRAASELRQLQAQHAKSGSIEDAVRLSLALGRK